jgi:probable F420-dependent oxidoreductase
MRSALPIGFLAPTGICSELRGLDIATCNDAIRRYVTRAEELGFESVWVSDHVHQIRPQDEGGTLESWTVLSAISQYTRRMKLGQLVLCVPFRNPALVAKMAASLDILSAGRLILGLGAGWLQAEFAGYGYAFLPPKERLEALQEAVEIIVPMLRGERVQFRGTHYQVDHPMCEPRPIQPRVPILLGGQGKVSLQLVARHADMANFTGSVETVADAQSRLNKYCDQEGRDPASIRRTWMTLAVLIRETQREVKTVIESLRSRDDGRIVRLELAGGIAGTPQQVCEQLQRYAALGLDRLMLTFTEAPSVRPLELFAERVMPELER